MRPNIKVSSTDATAKLKAALAALASKRVLVGVPEEDGERQKGEITNAQLVYIHTHGSPLNGIPARPIIEPAVEAPDTRAIISNELGEAARAALGNQAAATHSHLDRAGIAGSNAAKRWFTDPRNGWPADKPATVKRKGSDRPLIDTAQLRRSITHVVEDK